MHSARAAQGLAFYGFDLLWLNGKDLRRHALLERKADLADLLRRPRAPLLRASQRCDGRALFDKAGDLGIEGIVSKRVDPPYTPGPSKTWLKCKHAVTGDFPVIGYVQAARDRGGADC